MGQPHYVSHCWGLCRSFWCAGAADEELQEHVRFKLLEVLGAGDFLSYSSLMCEVCPCMYC